MFHKKKKPNPYKEANEAFLRVKSQEEGRWNWLKLNEVNSTKISILFVILPS